jgi:hypothetical protein
MNIDNVAVQRPGALFSHPLQGHKVVSRDYKSMVALLTLYKTDMITSIV